MIKFKDNTKYTSTADNLDEYLSLQNIANRNLSELLDENGNDLLIYPHSFYQCEDKIGNQTLLSLQIHRKEKRYTRAVLETGNMVGFIGINGQSISIHSRFSDTFNEDYFLHYMLCKTLNFNIINLPHSTIDEQVLNLLLLLFPKLLNDALAQGIYKEYQRNEYNDANVRGNINLNRHLKANMPFNGRIAYRTREFSNDNHVTELIRHTIEYISKTVFGKSLLENDTEIRASVAQIISATPHYDRQEREKIITSNLKPMVHPYFFRYTPLQTLCLRILKHENLKYGHKEEKVYGILFDISYLWEEYLGTILTKLGFRHPNNKKGQGRIYLASWENKNKFPRYPDFYREQDRTIIDAKYKSQIDERGDINQLVTYMYRLKGKYGIFVLPTVHEHIQEKYNLQGYGFNEKAELQKYMYPIPQNLSSYHEFTNQMISSEQMFSKTIGT